MKTHTGFDRLSLFYDLLVKLVFGRTIRESQICLIEEVGDRENWLVLGGGTGWVLEEIFKVHPQAKITYIEVSQNMINQAHKRRATGRVDYILGSIDEIPSGRKYDVVVTAFFWDMFHANRAMKMKQEIDLKLKNDAFWLCADFKNTDIWWQKILMRVMYWFFKVTCRIEASELPEFSQIFDKGKHEVLFQKTFHHGMIESTLYKRSR
jgi:ubiquinone/menaquinone biosynthesis C-methylase UbiE